MKYRIVCSLDDTWTVEEYIEGNWKGDWYVVYTCELKGDQGYYEAKAWIKRKEAEQTAIEIANELIKQLKEKEDEKDV